MATSPLSDSQIREHFPDDLVVRALSDGRCWQLTQRFRYIGTDGRSVVVPPYTIVNGASIPRCFWRCIGAPMTGEYRLASVIHDHLWGEAKAGRCTFSRANWVFLDAMRVLGVAPWRRFLMWLAVSLNGWRLAIIRRLGG